MKKHPQRDQAVKWFLGFLEKGPLDDFEKIRKPTYIYQGTLLVVDATQRHLLMGGWKLKDIITLYKDVISGRLDESDMMGMADLVDIMEARRFGLREAG